MKMIILTLLCVITACTSLQPVKLPPLQLQQKITSDEIAKVGDEVLIISNDGQRHEFTIVSKSATQLTGEKESILIAEIVALETRKISQGKTLWLAGGTLLFIQVLGAIATVMVIGG